jgi:hypothetical protein
MKKKLILQSVVVELSVEFKGYSEKNHAMNTNPKSAVVQPRNYQ